MIKLKNLLNAPVGIHTSKGVKQVGPKGEIEFEAFERGYDEVYKASPYYEITMPEKAPAKKAEPAKTESAKAPAKKADEPAKKAEDKK